ncbi:MAG: formylglycine-generating enzyme family protein [Candidatus Delongbacteria bacterium]|nr:formylglycine-generating enzyme family protein [Candidatus Delongbacteria bacterium]
MKNVCLMLLFTAALCFAGKLIIEYNDGTPDQELNFFDIRSIELIPAGFVPVPTGSFTMGDGDFGSPAHTVNITKPYYIGKYEVTQKEWQDVMGYNPCYTSFGLGDKYPIYNISWYDILVYCNNRSMNEGLTPCYTINGSTDPVIWGSIPELYPDSTWEAVVCDFNARGYRLPTEAEWEYAERYNGTGQYPWGSTTPYPALANYNTGKTTEVGSYPLGNTPLGLCDMAGNVSEWVWDWWYATYPSTAQTDPTGPATGTYRVMRGCSCGSTASWCNVCLRGYGMQFRKCSYGFRLARTP